MGSSIFDDENLIRDLISAGMDFENKFIKRSQATPTAPTVSHEFALKLIDDLESGDENASGSENTGSGAAPNSQALRNLVQRLPLNRYEINFATISTFFEDFRKILAGSKHKLKDETFRNMDTVESLMKTVSDMTANGLNRFDLSTNYAEIRQILKPPTTTDNYIPFLSQLQQLVINTANVVGNLHSMYTGGDERAREQLSDQDRAAIESQFQGPSSLKNQILEQLQGLAKDANRK